MINLVDPKLLADKIVERDVLKTCQAAFLCLQPLPSLRPPMSEIVAMLIHKPEGMASPIRPAFLERKNRTNRVLSWESVPGFPPSPSPSDSNTFPPPIDQSQDSASEVLPSLLRKFATIPHAAEKSGESASEFPLTPFQSDSSAKKSQESAFDLPSLMPLSTLSRTGETREGASDLSFFTCKK